MASTDARPVPQKNVAYRVTFPILDADGDLVTGATGLDSEVSKDGGTFADCTSEATEIATSSGMYFLDLTATEMNADCVAIIVKTSSVGAKTTALVMYPEEAGDIRVNVTHAADTAWNSGAIGAATLATDAITAAKIATNAIDADALAADAITEIQSGLATGAALAVVDGIVDEILLDTAVLPTAIEVRTEMDSNSTKLIDIVGDTNELQVDWINGGRLDLILDARASQVSVDDLPTNAELAAALATADDALLTQVALVAAAIAALDTRLFTTVMTESYAANGSPMSLPQALYSIQQSLQMFGISGLLKTVKKLDGSTTAFVITHNDTAAPSAATRT